MQLRFTGFVAGEFDQVATLEEFAEAVFLIRRQQVGLAQFVEEFLGRALRRAEREPIFQIPADGVGHEDAKIAWLADQGQRLLEFLFGPNVRRDNGNRRHLRPAHLPIAPRPEGQGRQRQRAADPSHPYPGVGNLNGWLDVAQIVRGGTERRGRVGTDVCHSLIPSAAVSPASQKICPAPRHKAGQFAVGSRQCQRSETSGPDPPARGPVARRTPPACVGRWC